MTRPLRLRVVLALAHRLIALLAPLAPSRVRARWTEEWHAEIDHAAERLAERRGRSIVLLSFAAGAIPDALGLRRLPRPQVPAAAAPRLIGVSQDLRRALRGLAHTPGFTLTVVLSLGLGLAANTAAFAFLSTTLFPGLPGAADSDRLVRVRLESRCAGDEQCNRPTTFEDLRVLRDGLGGLSGLAGASRTSMAIGARGQAAMIRGALVSANYFEVLGVALPLGRGFTPEEERPANAAVAVIGHGMWQRMFGGDPSALGDFITVGGHAVRVVGVASSAFGVASRWGMQPIEVWLPWGFAPTIGADRPSTGLRAGLVFDIDAIGRIDSSTSLELVRAQAPAAAARVAATRADGTTHIALAVTPYGATNLPGAALDIAGTLLVPVIVLAIACINAANLLLVRGQQRARDIAVRLAIGASRGRIAREVLIESLLLALLSGGVAVAIGVVGIRAVESLVPMTLRIDGSTIALTFVTAIVSVIAFGVVPALRASRTAPGVALASRSGTPSRSRTRQILVGAQVALSVALLAVGTQTTSAVAALSRITGADDPARLLIVTFDLSQFGMPTAAMESFYDRVAQRVKQLPGVKDVGVAPPGAVWNLPGAGLSAMKIWPPDTSPGAGRGHIGGYAGGDLFETIGLRLLQGRRFEPADRGGVPRVVIVSRAAAQRYFGGHAIGRIMRVSAIGRTYEQGHDVAIVGVVESPRDPNYVRRPNAEAAVVFLPAPLEPAPALALYVRALDDPAPLLSAIRTQVDAVDSRVPFARTATLASSLYERETEGRLVAQALAALGVIALVLATGGLYGAVSFIVSSRRREVGVRLALGAVPRAIVIMMVTAGLRPALAGGAAGGIVALIGSALLRASMFGIPAIDPVALVVPTALLVGAVLAASIVPARRAARVDPLVVLREE
jgi:putative ABC transport system permease protein